MLATWCRALLFAGCVSIAHARHPYFPLAPPIPPESYSADVATTGSGTFEQLIDHDNPKLGTFSQRFWWSSASWAGEGSPVVFFTPGESDASPYTGYLTNRTLSGVVAENIGGAVVLMEHRYWGESAPYSDLNAETLQYLTLKQSVADTVYFAKNVEFPFDTNKSSNADNAPWVFVGGSYSGALSAWVAKTAPGTFWAYHATSAPVEAIENYWQYFTPIQEGMPANCSKDVSLVVDYIDKVGKSGDAKKQQQLKTLFGLGGLEHYDDFAAALINGPWLWQSNSFYTGYSAFFQFCDAVENVVAGAATVPGPQGVGLDKALKGYAAWFTSSYLPGSCESYGYSDASSIACYDTYNISNLMFSDTSAANGLRTWTWFTCNEPLGYWQDGAPAGIPTVASRLATAAYWERQCPLFFPETNGHVVGSETGKSTASVNAWTGGWSHEANERIIWINGEFDPWRTSGVSSEYRPGGPLASTASTPVHVIPGGFHCSDLIITNANSNAGVKQVVDATVAQIVSWVDEYYN